MKTVPFITLVLQATDQDLRQCWFCSQCDTTLAGDMDLTMGSFIQQVLSDDPQVLACQTLWSAGGLSRARTLCPKGLDLEAVFLTLREEGWRRGIVDTII